LPLIPDLLYETRAIARSLIDYSSGAHVRLGVTGLSRAGKTIFITALIEHLTKAASPVMRGRKNTLPVFRVHAEGRLIGGALEPQPDDGRASPMRITSTRWPGRAGGRRLAIGRNRRGESRKCACDLRSSRKGGCVPGGIF
jgi:hypothetical protein